MACVPTADALKECAIVVMAYAKMCNVARIVSVVCLEWVPKNALTEAVNVLKTKVSLNVTVSA